MNSNVRPAGVLAFNLLNKLVRQSNEDIASSRLGRRYSVCLSPCEQHLRHLTRLPGGKFGREANNSYAASNDLCSGKCTSAVGPNLSICPGPTLIKES